MMCDCCQQLTKKRPTFHSLQAWLVTSPWGARAEIRSPRLMLPLEGEFCSSCIFTFIQVSYWISGVSGSVAPLALCLAVALRCQISPPPPAASNREEKAVPLCGVIMSFALRFQSRLMTDHLIMWRVILQEETRLSNFSFVIRMSIKPTRYCSQYAVVSAKRSSSKVGFIIILQLNDC